MKYSIAFATFIASALAAKACPAPPSATSTISTAPPSPTDVIPTGSKYFGALVSAKGTTIHLQAFNAREGNFFVGGKPNTSCDAPNGVTCPPGNETVFENVVAGKLDLAISGMGPQIIYVAPDGALKFTLPHRSGSLPEGSISDGFEMTAPVEGGSFGTFSNKAGPFLACSPAAGADMQIFVKLEGHGAYDPSCVEFSCLTLSVDKVNAWQYN
ncbi:predicted protein [Plenodomus lingam JN3]|uniref:Predicted protein n=1 Tax=Leptosphaeria maculans (strain JN3 / isolate v23.1.3 / race Av1-4-5-6-7-8) TaxID=985895 RepID=E5AF40_LEPMJ|nr:predicted protein [Plenodomus lingam JN3]CBY01829.1 predicted protein [Plenodomus lingam JN3]